MSKRHESKKNVNRDQSSSTVWRPLPRMHFGFAVASGVFGIVALIVASQTLVPVNRAWSYSGAVGCCVLSIALLVWNQFPRSAQQEKED